MGDGVQTLKAGVMEIADLFVVNKADRPEADRTVTDLKMVLGLGARDAWRPLVVTTVATAGEGIAEMLAAVADHRRHQEATGGLQARRRARWRREIVRIAEGRLRAQLLDGAIAASLDALVEQVAAGELDPHAAADRLLAR
jgi:LAO/AO transport system kinase